MRHSLLTSAGLLTLGWLAVAGSSLADDPKGPIKALIITGDTHPAHDWRATTPALKDVIAEPGKVDVDVTTTPTRDLTDANLAKYDVLILNYLNYKKPAESPETTWTDANKDAFLKAIRDDGKGLVVIHHASGSFARPNWAEFEKVVGGWRTQGFHGPAHVFTVKKSSETHPISAGAPAEFTHEIDELYQNSLLPPGSTVLATAYSDPSKPRGTGKDEAVIWVTPYGKGRVFENVLGHDVKAITDPGFRAWTRRGVAWAATGEVPADLK
jgi:type 1 glutamine amidotransferase